MAEVQPLKALHYNREAIPSLADVTAPPYDVIHPEQRAEQHVACYPRGGVDP